MTLRSYSAWFRGFSAPACVGLGLLVGLCGGPVPTARAETLSGAERRWHDEFAADGTIDIVIAFGFLQQKIDAFAPLNGAEWLPDQLKPRNSPFGLEPTEDPLSQLLSVFVQGRRKNLETWRLMESTARALYSHCYECGFEGVEQTDDGYVLRSTLEIDGRPVSLTATLFGSVDEIKIESTRAKFLYALKSADVVIYQGHARDGAGIPDFGPPLESRGKIYRWEPFRGWLGFQHRRFSQSKSQLLVLNGCKTAESYLPAFRALVWEKRPENLALIGTTDDNFFGDFPENALAVVTGVAARLNLADFSRLLESTARTHYRLSSRANPPPLFKIDGFMTDTYKNAPRPKRQNPNDIHPF